MIIPTILVVVILLKVVSKTSNNTDMVIYDTNCISKNDCSRKKVSVRYGVSAQIDLSYKVIVAKGKDIIAILIS